MQRKNKVVFHNQKKSTFTSLSYEKKLVNLQLAISKHCFTNNIKQYKGKNIRFQNPKTQTHKPKSKIQKAKPKCKRKNISISKNKFKKKEKRNQKKTTKTQSHNPKNTFKIQQVLNLTSKTARKNPKTKTKNPKQLIKQNIQSPKSKSNIQNPKSETRKRKSQSNETKTQSAIIGTSKSKIKNQTSKIQNHNSKSQTQNFAIHEVRNPKPKFRLMRALDQSNFTKLKYNAYQVRPCSLQFIFGFRFQESALVAPSFFSLWLL